jgi:hypothetical protein
VPSLFFSNLNKNICTSYGISFYNVEQLLFRLAGVMLFDLTILLISYHRLITNFSK